MTNKMLLEKIQGIELPEPVTHHMNALEPEDAQKIRDLILNKTAQDVEEKRVASGVIRRRRVTRPKPVEAEAAPPEAREPAPPPEEAPEEAPAPPTPAEPAALPEEKAKKPKKAKEETPAKVVKPAPAKKKPGEKAKPPKPAEEAPSPEPPAEAEAAAPPAEAQEAAPPEPAPVEEEKPKPKAQKKKKSEPAAKIISLPEHPVAPQPPPSARAEHPAVFRPTGPPPAGEETVGKRRKKGKKKGAQHAEEVDPRFFKKKISFRKKAVVEGKDLYDQAPGRHRKGKKGAKALKPAQTMTTTPKAIKRRIKVDEAIMLSDLAKRMGIKANELIKKLMDMGVMATMNQTIDFDTASVLASEFGYEVEKAAFEEETVLRRAGSAETAPEKKEARPPVVTIMGHVDHGKTSLLDAFRKAKTNVTDQEAGGITQHIGAYVVDTQRGRMVFLDTPGHEAFTAMRSRGSQITDIVILVVAADDGVMPQTIEAINHARSAGVPIIVAVNKMDKPNADPDKVLRELSEQGLVPEDWGGDTIVSFVSAKTREGLDNLLEMVLLQAEILELAADPNKPAWGHVIEARMDPGRGTVATVLVQEGTLRTGEPVVCGMHYGKVRAMMNELGQQVDEAGPSIPVEILGLSGVPMAGDELVAVENEKAARQVSEHRTQKQRNVELAKSSRLSLESLFDKMKEGEVKDLNIILKADVQGSTEALRESLEKLSGDEVHINIVHSGTGAVNESDVSLAAVSDALIIAFNVRPNAKVMEAAAEEHVEIRYYDVIYNMINDIKAAVVGMMESTFEEKILGRAEVRDTFAIPKVGTIAGSYVTDGKAERGANVRVVRDGTVVYDGKVGSLRRFKEDVKEVKQGFECGVGVENFNDIKVGDTLEFYALEEIKPKLE